MLTLKPRNMFFPASYEKKYKRLLIIFIVFLILSGLFVYSNINYIIFKYFISYNYVYTEALDEVYTEAIGGDNVKSYISNFDEMVISVVSDKISTAAEDKYTYLYTPQQYQTTISNQKENAKNAEWQELSENTVYLYLPNMSKFTREFVTDNTDNLKGYKNIIINLQNNSGGSLNDTYKIANLFLGEKYIIAEEETRSSFTSKTAQSKGNAILEYEKIIFLQNAGTASASEVLITALSENLENVTTMGETSYGKAIGQYTISLKKGYAVKATTMNLKTPEGNSIHKIGIIPDILYNKEDIIDFALKYSEGNVK